MKVFSLLALSMVLTLTCAHAQVGELDPQIIPQEIIVRVDAQGNQEVFKVALGSAVDNDQAAMAVVENYVTAENKVNVVAESELDQVSSTDSWYFYYNPYFSYGYGFGYNYFGQNFLYRPYYNYNFGYYNYYYYRYF